MKTLNEMKETNAAIIGDVGYKTITEPEHLAWLNEAYLRFYARVKPSFATATANSVASQRDYRLDTDVIQVHTIAYDGDELEVIMLDDWKRIVSFDLDEADEGTPEKAFILRTAMPGVVYLEPVPDASDKEIKIYYWDRPTSLSGTESPAINEEYVPALEAYARGRCFTKMKMADSAVLAIAEWEEAIKTALGSRPVTRVERTRDPAQGPRF